MYYICNGLKRKQYEKYGFPMTMTETEIAKELGYDRIWDCGLIKYVYRNPDYVEVKQFLTDIYY